MKLPLNNIIMRDNANEINKEGFYILNLDDCKGKGTLVGVILLLSTIL